MRALCINLRRSNNRWQFMQDQAARIGVQLERLDAIEGVAGLPADLRPQFLDSRGEIASSLNPAEVGCYASHLLAHAALLCSAEEFLAVVEDDAVLAVDFVEVAETAVKHAPAGWDILHLSTRFKRAAYPIAPLSDGRTLVRYSRFPVNTAGYLISRRGAEKFARPQLRVRPVDQEIRHAWLLGLEIVGVYPAPVRQSPKFASTIGKRKRRRWTTASSMLVGAVHTRRQLGIAGNVFCWGGLRRSMPLHLT